MRGKGAYLKRKWLRENWKRQPKWEGRARPKHVLEWQDQNGIITFWFNGRINMGQSIFRPMCSVDNYTLYHSMTNTNRKGINQIEKFCPSESKDVDWKEKTALYNFEMDPLWHELTLRILSTAEGEGFPGNLGICFCMRSQTCK